MMDDDNGITYLKMSVEVQQLSNQSTNFYNNEELLFDINCIKETMLGYIPIKGK
jgi:hypothetical protein